MASELPPFVSIVIPVLNDTERLRRCLAALEAQTYPSNRYEVIVVDNGSDDDPQCLATEYAHAVFYKEPQRGSYAARNCGVAMAKGTAIGFTDSDCIAQPDWIEKGVAQLHSAPNIGIVGGKVEFFFNDGQNPTAVELYDSIRNLQQEVCINKVKFAVTANLFTFREILQQVGLFDAAVISGGDRDWGQRVAAAGYDLIYGPDICVRHPARRTLRELHQKTIRVMKGHHQWKSRLGYASYYLDLIRSIVLDLSPPVRFGLRLRKDQRVHGIRNKVKVLLVFMFEKYVRAWTRLRVQWAKAAAEK